MVGDGGGRSQPANTTIVGGVHMVCLYQVGTHVAGEPNRTCGLIISMF
jgi:hypothetical protein